jgi:hypothetical protein
MQKWLREASDERIKQLVVSLIAILALVVWLAFVNPGASNECLYDCNTDISAQRR